MAIANVRPGDFLPKFSNEKSQTVRSHWLAFEDYCYKHAEQIAKLTQAV